MSKFIGDILIIEVLADIMEDDDLFNVVIEDPENYNKDKIEKFYECVRNSPEECIMYAIGLDKDKSCSFFYWIGKSENEELIHMVSEITLNLENYHNIFSNKHDTLISFLKIISEEYFINCLNLFIKYNWILGIIHILDRFNDNIPLNILQILCNFIKNNRFIIVYCHNLLDMINLNADRDAVEFILDNADIFEIDKINIPCRWNTEDELDQWLELYQKYRGNIKFELNSEYSNQANNFILLCRKENKELKNRVKRLEDKILSL